MAYPAVLRSSGSRLAVMLALVTAAPAVAQAQSVQDDVPAPIGQADPALADADPAEATTAAAVDAAPVEEPGIVITGTSIRGAPPVGSSLIQLDRTEIETSPSTTTTQIIREVPQIFNFGVTDAARNQSGGAGNIAYGNSINIRGIGPFATLTLINGRRPVPQGTLGASVDPSNIPAIALQRVEIIADGASAVYGSDAVSGVANLILRRRYEGLGVDVQYGFGDGFHEYTVNAIGGTDWGSGRFTVAGQHSFRSALSGLDRDFYSSDLTSRGGSDYRVTQCNPGNIQIAGALYAIPAAAATPDNLVAGTVNRCDNVKRTDILPQQEINSAVVTFDQDIGERIHFFADGLYARRDGFRRSAAAVQNIVVPETNAFFVAPAGVSLPLCPASAGVPAGTRCETVMYSFQDVFGPNATSDIRSEVWQITGGFDVDLGKDWHINLYGTHGKDHDHVFSVGNGVDAPNLAAALRSSNPATAFNPFGTGPNNPAVVAGIFNNLTDTDGRTRVSDFAAKIDGPLFHLPGGDVKIAVGAEYYDMHLRTGQIRGRAGAQTGTDQRLSRNVKSAYAELLIPIFGDENATTGFRSLDIDIAGRIDDYSDVGSTKNPKIGINWQPVEDLRLHGSYGESFRAPLLTNLVSAGGSQLFLQNYFDPTANGGAGATVRGVALSGGNLDLQPETARTWSFGGEYSPKRLKGAQLSLNYFDLVYEGQIVSYLSNLNVLRQEALFSSIILRGAAAQARIAELIASGRAVQGGSVAEALASPVFVEGRTNNLGTTITRGLDFGVVVPWSLGSGGDLRFTLRGTRFFTYKVALTPGGQINEQLNNIDFPLKLRMRGSIGWDRGPLALNLFANYQNGYDNTLVTPTERIKAQTTFDLSASYDLGGIAGAVENARLGVEVVNLFDQDPPFVDIAPTNNGGGGFDPTVASPLGRVISVSLRAKF
jgi:iron complex outermembrane recepter protein